MPVTSALPQIPSPSVLLGTPMKCWPALRSANMQQVAANLGGPGHLRHGDQWESPSLLRQRSQQVSDGECPAQAGHPCPSALSSFPSHFIDEEPETHRALHRAHNQSRAEPGPPSAPLRLCLRSQDPVFLMNLCCGHYSPTLFTVISLKHY